MVAVAVHAAHDRRHHLCLDVLKERCRGQLGPANRFLAAHRKQTVRTSIITASEVLLMFGDSSAGWRWLQPWTIYRLHAGIAQAAADVDRELIKRGMRLGENDKWIAGFARYYREALISLDKGFDVVDGLRRIEY